MVDVVFFFALVLLNDHGLLSPNPLSVSFLSFFDLSSCFSVVAAVPIFAKSQVLPHVPNPPESFLVSLLPKLNSSFGALSSRLISWNADGGSGAAGGASSPYKKVNRNANLL
jgi:hypothetical protein